MSQWIDRIENHEVNTKLQQLNDLLGQIEPLTEGQVESLEDYNRLCQINLFVINALANSDPTMVAISTLKNLNSSTQNIIQELTNYKSNKNRDHLVNANNHADNLILHARTLLAPADSTHIESLRDTIVSFRKSAGQLLRHIEEDFNKLKTQINELSQKSEAITNEITIQKGRLDTAITQFQQQFSDSAEKRRELFAVAEKERNDEHKQAILNMEEKLSKIYDEYNNNYIKYVEKIDSELIDKISEFNKQLDAIHENEKKVSDELKESTNKQIETLSIKSQKLLDELELKRTEASNIVQIIGNIGVTGNYQRIANQEKKAADSLRIIALSLMVCMVLVIGLTIFISAKNGFDWKLSLFRIGAALVLAIPATYAASESSKHRIAEHRNRQAELELASIDPFLEKMPDETKNELKAKLTDRFFGCSKIDEDSSAKVTSTSLFDLIKMTIENLTKK